MIDCPLSGRSLGYVSNFCISDLENFATASRRCIGAINYYFYNYNYYDNDVSFHFYCAMLCSALPVSVCLSVCPSVRLSVTSREFY